MWDLLKSKISNFISKIAGDSGEKKQQETSFSEQKVNEEVLSHPQEEVVEEKPHISGVQPEEGQESQFFEKEKIGSTEVETKKVEQQKESSLQKPMADLKENKEATKQLIPFSIPFLGGQKTEPKEEMKLKQPKESFPSEQKASVISGEQVVPTYAQPPLQKEGIEIKVGITDKIKKAVLGKVKLSKEKIEEITDELEFSLIQADVHPDVAAEVCKKIKERMISKEFSRDDLEGEIREILKEIFREEAFGGNKVFDLIEKVREGKKPYKILFVGPNGAGKTTTIAKVAKMLMDAGFTVVISASDTFRAAAIEQTEEHGKRLGVRVIRQNYGADAAAVAFDAIKHAEANNIDVVLIDSAGRQDTNFNLLKELQKINRIASPDLRIFIGEAIAGNSLYQQVSKFKEMIGLDGVILTKVDCDAKGGTAISILRETGVPIIYLGMGQSYTDLKKFDAAYIIDNIV